MRNLALALCLAVSSLTAAPAVAQSANPGQSAAPAQVYSTANTEIGTLLDDPQAKAIVEKHIPGLTTGDQIDMARPMTLKAIQQYAPKEVTDERLAAIDADFAKLAADKAGKASTK